VSDFTESGLGAVILELVAYVGDQLSFYLDRQVNEMFLPTAAQRESVLNLVNLIGYVPRSTSAAVAPIRATLNIVQVDPTVIQPFTNFIDKASNQWEFLQEITIPAGRVDTYGITITDEVLGQGDGTSRVFSFLADNENINTTGALLKVTIGAVMYQIVINSDGSIPVPFGGTGIIDFDTGEVTLNFTAGNVPDNASNMLLSYTYNQEVTAYQGVTKLDVFSSDGTSDQQFVLTNSPVLISPKVEEGDIVPNPNRFEVWVGDPGTPFGGATGTLWSRVDSLAVAGPTQNVYSIRFDDQDRLILEFGDNSTGAIPPAGVNNVSVIYRVGGGTKGNVSVNFISSTVSGTAGLFGVQVSISNFEAATGGRERESLNEVRVNAPAFLKTNDTATTEEDFDTLSIYSKSGIGSVSRAKSRLTPSQLILTKTIHVAESLATIPVSTPLEYFLLLPASPIVVTPAALAPTVQYTIGGVLRTSVANDLGGGLASLVIGDGTIDPTTRLRYDEQNFTNEVLGYGTGVLYNFSNSLVGFPIFPTDIIFRYTIGGDVFVGYDDGAGNLISSHVAFGSINYRTGAVVLEFGTHAIRLSQNAQPYDLNAINGGGPVTLTVKIDGGGVQTITFQVGDFALYNAATAAEVVAVLTTGGIGGVGNILTGATCSVVSNSVQIRSNSFGPNSKVEVTGGNANDATNGFNFLTAVISGTGSPPDNATAILFDYQSCLDLILTASPTIGSEILFSGESGPSQKEFPTNNVEVYTWAEDANGNLVAPTTALKDNLKNFLDTRRVLGTSVQILSGFNVLVHYTMSVTFDPSVSSSDATQEIIDAIEAYFASVVDVSPGNDVPIAAVYDAVFPTHGVVSIVITDVGVRVPIGTGNAVRSVFKDDPTKPGQYVSTLKLPAKTGTGKIKVYKGTTEIGSSDASTPIAGLSGVGIVAGSTFNKTTGVFDIRVTPVPDRGEVIAVDFLLDNEILPTIWNVDINEWEVAVLGDIYINGIKVR
jgi:hypothetical protein